MQNAIQTAKLIENGAYDARFEQLYGEDARSYQRERYINALKNFAQFYGADRDVCIYSAPGRTEIGGNHTDHNNGLVMAASVNLDIIAVVAKNTEPVVRVRSQGFEKEDVVNLDQLVPDTAEHGHSAALIRGVAAGISERGGIARGFDAYTTSSVLKGSGLSSSAAFEVCLGEVFNGEYNSERYSPIELGIIGRYAENMFFGKPSGLMDQLACAVGGAITIDFEHTNEPNVQKIPLNLESFGHRLVICDTKGSHAELTDEYAAIRGEMEIVAHQFGKSVLREVPEKDFYRDIATLRKECSDRALLRAMHYYGENRRVVLLAKAIGGGDFDSFLKLINEGGHSSFEYNQNAYSLKNINRQGMSLGLALSQYILAGRGAQRLQGSGFAGTIQAFVPDDLLDTYCELLNGVFGKGSCHVLLVRNTGCVKV